MWEVGDLMNRWEMLQQETESLEAQAPSLGARPGDAPAGRVPGSPASAAQS
jgi:hypothetical protein